MVNDHEESKQWENKSLIFVSIHVHFTKGRTSVEVVTS